MQLFIEQSSFKTIYSSSPKLVIADCDRHVWEKMNINNEFDVYIFKIDPELESGYLIGSNTEIAEVKLLESDRCTQLFVCSDRHEPKHLPNTID